MRILLAVILTLAALCAEAQPNKVYRTMADYACGNGDTVPGLRIKHRYAEEVYSSNSRLLRPYTGDKKIDKGLDTAVLVEINDSIYVNLFTFNRKNRKPIGYIPAELIEGSLYYRVTSIFETKEDMESVGYAIAGPWGAGMMAKMADMNEGNLPDMEYRCCHPNGGPIQVVGPVYLQSLLEPYKDLAESYKNEPENLRCKWATIGKYLRLYKERRQSEQAPK